MADNIPFEIQVKIMKMLSVKSLIQFRFVSKQWKSLIDGSEFITSYHPRSKQHQLLVNYTDLEKDFEPKYVSISDNNNNNNNNNTSLTVPIPFDTTTILGSSQGLFCICNYYENKTHSGTMNVVLWNPSIRKSVAIIVPNVLDSRSYKPVIGFGVCRRTNDPKLVKITFINDLSEFDTISYIPWQVEVFRLSVGVWRSLPSINLPCNSVTLSCSQVVIKELIYRHAFRMINEDVESKLYDMIMSFDINSEEFTQIYLPDSLAHDHSIHLSIYKLNESLTVIKANYMVEKQVYGVWMMIEQGVTKSFTKLYTINTPYASIRSVLGFRKSGEPIITIVKDFEKDALFVYEPCSGDINYIGIHGEVYSFLAHSYKETLLLLDQ